MPEINDVSPVSSNTSITSTSDNGSPPFQSVNGRMLALASSPDGTKLFAGSFSNVWTSVDDGQTWAQVTWQQPQSGQFSVPGALGGSCVVDIAVSPVDPQIVLVITRNDHGSSDHGIWRSTDGGSSWTRVYQFKTSPTAAGQLAWPAGSGRLVFAAGGSALAISRDGGASFQEDLRVGPINHVAVFPPLPNFPGHPVVYALGDGVMFVSVDGGGNWMADGGPIQRNWGGAVSSQGNTQAPSVLVVSPRSPLEVFLVANANGGRTVSPVATALLFASVYHFQHHFAYRDAAGTIWDSWWDGNSWQLQQINNGSWQKLVPAIDPAQAEQARRFFVSPYNPDLVYILDTTHVRRSDDGGKTWQQDTSLENQLTSANAIPIARDLVLTDMHLIRPIR